MSHSSLCSAIWRCISWEGAMCCCVTQAPYVTQPSSGPGRHLPLGLALYKSHRFPSRRFCLASKSQHKAGQVPYNNLPCIATHVTLGPFDNIAMSFTPWPFLTGLYVAVSLLLESNFGVSFVVEASPTLPIHRQLALSSMSSPGITSSVSIDLYVHVITSSILNVPSVGKVLTTMSIVPGLISNSKRQFTSRLKYSITVSSLPASLSFL